MSGVPEPWEAKRDEDQLRLLVTLHYVWAALSAFFAFTFGGLFLVLGIAFPRMIASMPPPPAGSPNRAPPKEFF